MSTPAKTITLQLTTAAGCVGAATLAYGQEHTMKWNREPEGADYTVQAEFFVHIGNDLLDNHEIDGDDWRSLESSGSLDRAVYWIERDWSPVDAIESAVAGCDPDDADRELYGWIDELKSEITMLRAALAETDGFLREIRAENLDGSEPAVQTRLDENAALFQAWNA